MGFLDIRNVTKSYGNVEVLHRVDIAVEEGEFLVLVGPSGCGKSTLLNMIAGLEAITGGEIAIKGRVVNGVHPSKRNIAMVFQSYALYPNMTVGQNMTFGLEMHGVPKPERDKALAEVGKLLQIDHLLDRKPGQLVVVDIGCDYLRAFRGERFRDRMSDALACSGDDGGLSEIIG